MDTMRICSGCHKPLAPNAPDGLCPKCLLKAGRGAGVDLGPDRRLVVGLCVAAFYLPYAWLLFVDGLWPWNAPRWTWTQLGITPWTWSSVHWLWIKLWLILPGLVPTWWFNAAVGIGRLADWLEFLIGGLVTAVLLGAVGWAALRGGRWTPATMGVAFLISGVFSWMAYNFYAW
jgi:hypothetical protein